MRRREEGRGEVKGDMERGGERRQGGEGEKEESWKGPWTLDRWREELERNRGACS